jgi:hypothetical protein
MDVFMDNLNFVPVFVGGVPRSGTTILSALLSTAEDTNEFLPEFHYLGHLADAFTATLAMIEGSQKHFFTSRNVFIKNPMDLIEAAVNEAWVAQGIPKYLIIKHCKLTPIMGYLARRFTKAKFLAIYRDPRNVYSSLKKVSEKSALEVAPEVPGFIGQFNTYYRFLIASFKGENLERLLGIRYEKLESSLEIIEDFLEFNLRPESVWTRAKTDIKAAKDDFMFSDLWGKPLSVNQGTKFQDFIDEKTASDLRLNTRSTSIMFSIIERSLEQGLRA